MNYLKKLLLLTLLCFPLVSHAQCEQLINSLLEKYHPSRTSDMAICKVWPADENKTIVVLPLINEIDEYDIYDIDLDVLLVDSQSGELITHNWQANALTSDAIRLVGFEIDTARYLLNPQSRAFGVRINFRGSSQPNPSSEQLINLYVMQNNKLNQVINQLVMYSYHGEWDTHCDGEFSQQNRTLSIGKQTTKNYSNLILSEKSEDRILKLSNDNECIEETINLPQKTFILKYDGVEYPILNL